MNPQTWTIVVLIVAAAAGLAAAALAQRRGGNTPFLARAASYAVLAAVLAGAVATGALGVTVLVTIVALIGLVEWSNLGRLPLHHRLGLLIATVVLMVALYEQGVDAAAWLVGGLVLAGMLWPVIRADTGRAIRDLGFTAVGFISITVLMGHAVVLARDFPVAGVVIFASVAVACAGSDVGAYIVGKRFGRTKLAPSLSPNKTIAGVAGNFGGAAIGLALFVPALLDALQPAAWSSAYVVLLVLLVAVGSIWGDLFESAVKREAGVKDAGSWLPGFGGLLDRVDSLLVTVPLAYWMLRLFLATQ